MPTHSARPYNSQDHAGADGLRPHHWDHEDDHQQRLERAQAVGLETVAQIIGQRQKALRMPELDEFATHQQAGMIMENTSPGTEMESPAKPTL